MFVYCCFLKKSKKLWRGYFWNQYSCRPYMSHLYIIWLSPWALHVVLVYYTKVKIGKMKLRGYIKNHWANIRLDCTHLNQILSPWWIQIWQDWKCKFQISWKCLVYCLHSMCLQSGLECKGVHGTDVLALYSGMHTAALMGYFFPNFFTKFPYCGSSFSLKS